jgi:ubiquinone/menaquinone biosynthesis C-methylase UbiE
MTNSNSSSIPTMGAILEADEQGTVVTALKTALELDVFEIVAKGPQSAEEIAGAVSCSVRGMSVLLDALCVKGLLDKNNGYYSLTPTSETYLVRSGRGYCVPIYLAWLQAREKFIDFVKTGKATLDLTSPQAEEIWASYAAPDRVRLPELVEIVTKRWTNSGILSRMKPGAHILDLGCGSGFKSFSLLKLDPSARVTGVDSPKVLEISEEIAGLMGIASRVTLQTGDVDRELPANTYDMVIIGSLLHYFDAPSATDILRSAYRALKENGIIVIYAKAADEERKTDPSLLSMIDVSNCAPFARHYTYSEYKTILENAGFRDVTQTEIVIISAVKP